MSRRYFHWNQMEMGMNAVNLWSFINGPRVPVAGFATTSTPNEHDAYDRDEEVFLYIPNRHYRRWACGCGCVELDPRSGEISWLVTTTTTATMLILMMMTVGADVSPHGPVAVDTVAIRVRSLVDALCGL